MGRSCCFCVLGRSRLLLVVTVIFGIYLRPSFGAGRATSSSSSPMSRFWSEKICYNPKQTVKYIKNTKAWKEGRLDILDWGCGGGTLLVALAKQNKKNAGANNNKKNKLVGVELGRGAVKIANQRLASFPNAKARLPDRSMTPGTINYKSAFDLVISQAGALSYGTTPDERIEPNRALVQAVTACRKGGSIVIFVVFNGFWKRIGVSLSAMQILTMTKKKPKWLLQFAEWKWSELLMVAVGSGLIGMNPIWPMLFHKEIVLAANGKSVPLILRLYQLGRVNCIYDLVRKVWRVREFTDVYVTLMKAAGLHDIKVSSKRAFPMILDLERNWKRQILMHCQNKGLGWLIYEGKKPE